MIRINPGNRVEHLILGYRGYVQSVMSGNPRTVHVKTDAGKSEFALDPTLKVVGTDMTSAQHRQRGMTA